MGRKLGKVDAVRVMDRIGDRAPGKYVDVTAITPTPLGEGKTTTSMGLVQGLGCIGKSVVGAIRQPSGGPTFNIKGSAAGGGLAQCIPLTEFSLGLCGDIDAITNAHNLAMVALTARMQHENNYDDARLAKTGMRRLDIDPSRVQAIKDSVSRAVIADATDPKAIEPLEIKEMDAVVVAMGSELNASILATLTLKDLGVQRVLAKALTEPQGRILLRIGASEVIFPEKDSAINLAERLENPNILDYLPFLEGYSIIELTPPKAFVGKTLKDLNLINRYGVQVIAVKEIVPDKLNLVPTGEFLFKDSDIMILLGSNEGLDRLRKAVS